MIYKISKDTDSLRILGENFVNNNGNKGNIIINNKKEKIKGILPIKNLRKNKIKMVLSKSIYNISCLFKDCELLESLSCIKIQNINDRIDNLDDMQLIDEENIILVNNMNITDDDSEYNTNYFYDISELTKKEENTEISFSFLSNQFNKKLNLFVNMSYMFSNCNSLKYIPDISIWKTNNIDNSVNMSYMFYNCYSLSSLPDISNWKTDNVNDMSYLIHMLIFHLFHFF